MFCTGKSAAMSGIWGLLIANDIFNPKITGLRTMSKGWILRQEIWKLWAGVGTNLGKRTQETGVDWEWNGKQDPWKKIHELSSFSAFASFFWACKMGRLRVLRRLTAFAEGIINRRGCSEAHALHEETCVVTVRLFSFLACHVWRIPKVPEDQLGCQGTLINARLHYYTKEKPETVSETSNRFNGSS